MYNADSSLIGGLAKMQHLDSNKTARVVNMAADCVKYRSAAFCSFICVIVCIRWLKNRGVYFGSRGYRNVRNPCNPQPKTFFGNYQRHICLYHNTATTGRQGLFSMP